MTLEIQDNRCAKIIAKLLEDKVFNDTGSQEPTSEYNPYVMDYGIATESGKGSSITDIYVETELTRKIQELESEDESKIAILMKTLSIPRNQAENMVRISKVNADDVRPDQTFRNTKTGLDQYIRYEIVPEILLEYSIKEEDYDLESLPLFSQKDYGWIIISRKNNPAYLAMAFNTYLKNLLANLEKNKIIDKLNNPNDFIMDNVSC